MRYLSMIVLLGIAAVTVNTCGQKEMNVANETNPMTQEERSSYPVATFAGG